MADTAYTPLKVTRNGLTNVWTSGIIVGTTDFAMKNDGRTIIKCKKSGAGACTVTFKTPAQVRGLDLTDPTGTVPATTGDIDFGPFEPLLFNDAAGVMRFNFSEVTGLTFMGETMG
jgi:hypothetical protein